MNISTGDGYNMIEQLGSNNAKVGSEGSVKDGVGRGYAFFVSDNSFTAKIWGEAQTIGHRSDMSSLRVEHGGELGIMLLIYTMQI